MAYTLGGTNLGQVKRERHGIKSHDGMDIMPMPMSDSNSTLVFDYSGVVRTITIEGTYTDTSQANLMNNFIVPIEAMKNGDQTSPVTYHSDLLDASTSGQYTNGNVSVYVDSFEWDYIEGEVLMIRYKIMMVEGT